MVRERTVAVIAVAVLAFGIVAALAVGDGDEVALEPERTTTTSSPDETTTTTEDDETTTTKVEPTTSAPTSTTTPATTATTAGATTTTRATATTAAPPTTARPATTATTAPPATTATTRPAPTAVPLEVYTTGRTVRGDDAADLGVPDGSYIVTVRASNPRRGTDGGPVDLGVAGVSGQVALHVVRTAGPVSCGENAYLVGCGVADSPGGGRFLDVQIWVQHLQPCRSANEFRVTATIESTLFPDVTDTASIIAC